MTIAIVLYQTRAESPKELEPLLALERERLFAPNSVDSLLPSDVQHPLPPTFLPIHPPLSSPPSVSSPPKKSLSNKFGRSSVFESRPKHKFLSRASTHQLKKEGRKARAEKVHPAMLDKLLKHLIQEMGTSGPSGLFYDLSFYRGGGRRGGRASCEGMEEGGGRREGGSELALA